jgi:hypothetical protein
MPAPGGPEPELTERELRAGLAIAQDSRTAAIRRVDVVHEWMGAEDVRWPDEMALTVLSRIREAEAAFWTAQAHELKCRLRALGVQP